MINSALDGAVWGTTALFLVLIGARAWVVETGQGRLGRTPAKVQVLTGATAVVLAGLLALLTVQGGALLFESIVTGTDPLAGSPADPTPVDPAVPVDPAAPAAVDPAAPAAPAPAGPAAPVPAPPAGG
jgi:hypothetical protein